VTSAITKAVVLARGLGTRMRRADDGAALDAGQAEAAAAGVKALIPVGRPFLDYVLGSLADAGYRDICLVIGPEHDAVRDRYARELKLTRVRVHFSIQQEPRGTADAVAAAERFAAGNEFLVVNSDNLYPVAVLRALRKLAGPGLALFSGLGLVRDGDIPPERLRAFSVVTTDADGFLVDIVEKPDEATFASFGDDPPVSMNCWRLPPAIFAACRDITASSRGELELPDAVRLAVSRGVRFAVVLSQEGVLDLTRRADIAAVTARLRDVPVAL
jgi:glucose-1-phosphate thymidylyltransferase